MTIIEKDPFIEVIALKIRNGRWTEVLRIDLPYIYSLKAGVNPSPHCSTLFAFMLLLQRFYNPYLMSSRYRMRRSGP